MLIFHPILMGFFVKDFPLRFLMDQLNGYNFTYLEDIYIFLFFLRLPC